MSTLKIKEPYKWISATTWTMEFLSEINNISEDPGTIQKRRQFLLLALSRELNKVVFFYAVHIKTLKRPNVYFTKFKFIHE